LPVRELDAGREDAEPSAREAEGMGDSALPPPQPDAIRQLVDAVLALSDDPAPANVQRYLAVSRALEASRSKAKTSAKRAA
jgi:hypothetical protein